MTRVGILALSVFVVGGLVASIIVTARARGELVEARETIRALTLEVVSLRGDVDSASVAAEQCSASIEALNLEGMASVRAARVALEQAVADLDRLRHQLTRERGQQHG